MNITTTLQRAPKTVALVLRRTASAFSPASRSLLTFAVLAFCVSNTWLKSALEAPPHIDEMAWVDRSLKPLWGEESYPHMYYYARHHPALTRIVYGWTLHALGIYKCDRPLVNYGDDVDWDWNLAHGAYPPLEIETPLRLVNVAFLSGMLALVYFGFKRMFRNRLAAFACCLPVVFCHPIYAKAEPYIGVAAYIGTDSMLLFWLAAFWYVWLVVGRKGAAGVLALAVVGGLLISTKVNGAFALAGAFSYYAATARGYRRVLFPALLATIPFAIFVAMNPVYRAGDLHWMAKSLRDMGLLMFKLKDYTGGREWGQFTRWQVLTYTFPYVFFYLPVAAVAFNARHEKWLWPTLMWAAPSIILNWLLIYVPFPRYAAPIAVPFLVLFAAAGAHLIITTLSASRERVGCASGEDS